MNLSAISSGRAVLIVLSVVLIGSIAGAESELFTSITGVTRAGNNTVVADTRTVDVRFYGPRGEFLLRVFGRRGRGPGELQAIRRRAGA